MPQTDGAGTPEVTVVLPTRNRVESLVRCLSAIDRERRAGPGLEIVVVDDGSRDADGVAAAAASVSARLVRLGGAGVSAARNAGARVAQAPVICFTDDDCEPQPDWAARLADRVRSGADLVAGPTIAAPGSPLSAATQLVANAMAEQAQDASLRTQFAPASNIACRRSVLEEVPFDERFQGIGAEDREWATRAAARGYRLAFEPDAVVLHAPEPTFRGFWHRHVRYGRGAFRFRRTHLRGRLEQPAFYAGLIADGFRSGVATGALVCVAQAATAVGYLLEAAAARGKPLEAGR